uniref:Uncharacterized protein n=1 Tax=Branchiostoma floridae TaxID=7739 RepID=C3ZLZ6_BRAFL|eukprot:XP_002590466.1 hypothetical protein BRAFLDRAFT_124563 [Branchiostoma floridae]
MPPCGPRNGRARSSGSLQFGMSRSEEDVREQTKEKSHRFSGLKDSLRRSFRVPSRDEQERRPKGKPKDRSQVVMGSWAGGEDAGRKKRSNSRDSGGGHRQAGRTCSPQGRKNGHPDRSRIRRARSDVGSRRNLRVTKLSTQQTLSQRNLRNKDVSRQMKASAKAREIKTFYNSTEYVEGENGATKKYRLQNSPNKTGDGIQDLDSRSYTSTETLVDLVSQEEEDEDGRHGKSRRPKECVTGYDDLKETTIGTSRLRKSYKLRRSKSDVNVSYRGRGRGEFWDPNDGHRSSPYKKHIPSEKRSPYLMKQDFRERMIEDKMDSSPRSPVKARRKRRPGDGQVSSTLRGSLSDVDVSYRGNRKGHTSPRHHPTRRPIPVDNDPKDAIFKDAEAVETDDRRKHNRTRDHRRRFGMPSNLRRSMSDVDVSYHATNRAYNTSPTRHEQFLYNVPPVEYAEDCSEGKISDENLVILGSFKAGEDTGRKGKDGRTPTEPIGAGAKIVTGLVDSVKQSLGIPGEEVKEGETTYTDHLPDLIQGWATRQYTESKKNDDSGLIHSLKESLLSSARMDETKQHPGRKGGTTDPPGLLGSWAGGEDSGRKSTDEPGPLGFLGSLRRSFRMSSGEDPSPYGGEGEPVSPVFTGTFVSGENTGRNRKGGTSGPENVKNNSKGRSRTRRFRTNSHSTGKGKHKVIRLSTQQQCCLRNPGDFVRRRNPSTKCANYVEVDRQEYEMVDDAEGRDICTGKTSNNKQDEHRDDVAVCWLEDDGTESEDSEQSLIYSSGNGSDGDVEEECRVRMLPRNRKSPGLRRSLSDFDISYDESGIRSPTGMPKICRSTSDEYWSNIRGSASDFCISNTSVEDMYVIGNDNKRKHTAPTIDRRVAERLRSTKPWAKQQCKDDKGSSNKKKRNKERVSGVAERLLYNAPPMEYVEDSSDEKLSDENLVIMGSFKAGEDNTSRRRSSQPIGAGANILSGFVTGAKTFLRIPEKSTVEDRGRYEDHIPSIVHNMVIGEDAGKKQEENSSLLDRCKKFFASWTTGESEKRRPAFVGSWEGGEDTGSHRDAGNSGFINSLKESLWGDSPPGTREQFGWDGDKRKPPISSWVGDEDTGRDRSNATEDSGPLGFLVSRVRSFWLPSDKDGRAGKQDKPAGSVLTGSWAGGEDTGRDHEERKGSPSFMDKLPSLTISPPPDEKSNRNTDNKETVSWLSPRTWWSAIKDLFDTESNEKADPSWAGPACRRKGYRRKSYDKNSEQNTLHVPPVSWWPGNKNTKRRRGSNLSSDFSDSSFSMSDLDWFSKVAGRKKTERRRKKTDRKATLGPFQGILD